jgi:predicted phosphoribosyltransferase
MRFKNRKQAGKKLAQSLTKYQSDKTIVLAIPRGGTELGFQVARELSAKLDLIIVRKLPYPDNPEAGFGAMAEDGTSVINPKAQSLLSQQKIKEIIQVQQNEIERRIKTLRRGQALSSLKDKTVIVVDDGIAVGSTMIAAIKMCQKQEPAKVAAAAPVGPRSSIEQVERFADETAVLETPSYFRAVAQFYQNWHDVSDEEVHQIMARWKEYQSD